MMCVMHILFKRHQRTDDSDAEVAVAPREAKPASADGDYVRIPAILSGLPPSRCSGGCGDQDQLLRAAPEGSDEGSPRAALAQRFHRLLNHVRAAQAACTDASPPHVHDPNRVSHGDLPLRTGGLAAPPAALPAAPPAAPWGRSACPPPPPLVLRASSDGGTSTQLAKPTAPAVERSGACPRPGRTGSEESLLNCSASSASPLAQHEAGSAGSSPTARTGELLAESSPSTVSSMRSAARLSHVSSPIPRTLHALPQHALRHRMHIACVHRNHGMPVAPTSGLGTPPGRCLADAWPSRAPHTAL